MEPEIADPRPLPPPASEPDACCGEGCVHCVLDCYDEAVARWREALAAWRQRHPEAEIDRLP